MNAEAVEEMFDRLIKIKALRADMLEAGICVYHTPYGPVKLSEVIADERFIESMLIDELDDMPITGILVNLI